MYYFDFVSLPKGFKKKKNSSEVISSSPGKWKKSLWVIFWIQILVFQALMGTYIYDPDLIPALATIPDVIRNSSSYLTELPEFFNEYFAHIIFVSLIPIWIFSIKYRHSKITMILMGIASIPSFIIIGSALLMILIGIVILLVVIFIAMLVLGGSGSGSHTNNRDTSFDEVDRLREQRDAEREAQRRRDEGWTGY